MIKMRVVYLFAFVFSMLVLAPSGAHAQCGFNGAGDYTCEGEGIRVPGQPPAGGTPSYGGPNEQNMQIPGKPPYTPGDLNPGIPTNFEPFPPVFTIPPSVSIPPVYIPPIQSCEAVVFGPPGSGGGGSGGGGLGGMPNMSPNQCTGEHCMKVCGHSASKPKYEHCDASNMGPASRAEVEASFMAVLENHEGKTLQPYPDGIGANGQQLYSIGIGHQIKPGEQHLMNGITDAQAYELARQDMQWAIDSAYQRAADAGVANNKCAIVAFAGAAYQKGGGWAQDRTGESGGQYDFSQYIDMMGNGQYCEAAQYAANQKWFSNSQWTHLNNRECLDAWHAGVVSAAQAKCNESSGALAMGP